MSSGVGGVRCDVTRGTESALLRTVNSFTVLLPILLRGTMVKRCVAAGCSNTYAQNVSLFCFPRDPALRKRWTRELQRTRDQWSGPTEHSVLCSDHFKEDCFETETLLAPKFGISRKPRLKPNAVPTIFTKQPAMQGGAFKSTVKSSKRAAVTQSGCTLRKEREI